MANTDIQTNITIGLSDYERQMTRAIKQADNLDAALDAISNTKITPMVEIDTGNLEQVKQEIASALDSSYTVNLDVQDSELKSAQDLLNRLESAAPTIKVNANDSEVTAVKRKVDDLDGEAVDIDVNADDSELSAMRGKLDELRNLAVIDLAFNLAGSIPTPDQIPILSAIIDADTAARSLQATLGAGFNPQQAAEAQDVYTNNFGATQLEAAQAYASVVQSIGNDLGTAAESGESLATVTGQIFTVAEVSGEDFLSILDAVDKLYSTGMVDSYAEGLDLITTGFQNGLNTGDDLLDTIREYAPQFEELGFSADEAFNMLKTGMDAGAYNTDFIADLIKEMNIRAQAAMAGSGVEFDALKAMGLLDEAEAYAAGEITGKAYAEAVAEAATTGLESGTITPQTIFDALGTKAEDLTIPVTLEILGTTGGGAFGDTEGTVSAAGDALFGGLGSSIETARRLIETEVAASVDKAFDIQGKIESFNTGIKEFSALVQGGEDIPAAIEKAFNLDGFAETFARFESAIGNLVIEVASLIANILEATGNTGGAESTRATVSDLATQQLAFDLKLQDDGAGIQSAVMTALRRGVDDAGLAEALSAAGGELIAEGDLLKAQQFVEALQGASAITLPADVVSYLSGKGIDPTNLTAVRTELEAITSATTNVLGIETFLSPIEGMGALDFDELIGTVALAEQAQTAAAPIAAQFEGAMLTEFETMFTNGQFIKGALTSFGLGESGMGEIFTSEISAQLQGLPEALFTGMSDMGAEIPLLQLLETGLDNASAKVDEVMPAIGSAVDTHGVQTFQAFSNATNAAANALLTQVPIIGEQTTTMQQSLIATSTEVGGLTTAVGGLNTASLAELGGQFAGLRSGVENQVNYAIQQVQRLQAAITGLGNTQVGIPGFTLSPISGGSHMYGGVIPAGTVGVVHGNEILAGAPPGTDISVLNQQTSNVIEGALAALMGGSAIGGFPTDGEAIDTNPPPIVQDLVLDFQVQTDGAGIQNIIKSAIEGGVDAAELEASLLTAGRDLISQGDLDKASAFVDDLKTAATIELPAGLTDYLSGKGIDPTDLQAVQDELMQITDEARALGDISEFASPVAGMSLVDFEGLLDPVAIAAQAQTALEPLQSELQAALASQSNLDLGLDIQGMLNEALASGDSEKLAATLKSILDKASTDASTALNTIGSTGAGMGEAAPAIGEAITAGVTTPISTASGAVGELATLLSEQFPSILEQLGILQTGMNTEESVISLDTLKASIEGLNTVSLSGLSGQFAALRSGIDDQVVYATEQIMKLQGALNGLGGTSIGVPNVSVPGIAGDGGSHLYGGVIPGGTIGQVHGNEIFAAAPEGTDISVLNAASSSVIEGALSALMGGGVGRGDSNVTYNNQFVYNVQSNAQGFMSDGAARAARGF